MRHHELFEARDPACDLLAMTGRFHDGLDGPYRPLVARQQE